jgi:hypothetical protein
VFAPEPRIPAGWEMTDEKLGFSIRRDVIDSIGNPRTAIAILRLALISDLDDPYSIEQLKAPRMNISVVRPLVEAFYEMQDVSVGM